MRRVCVFVALFFLHIGVLAGQDRPHLSSDPQVSAARILIEGGRFDAALVILRPLAPDHADRTDVLFLLGLAAIGASQDPGTVAQERDALLDEAIAALGAILVDRPDLVRVRLELARAFFLKEEDDLSREHFERVLAGRPLPAVEANIRRFLGAIKVRRRWSGHFGFALAPDSNLNTASDERVIYIFGLPFRRNAEAGASSGLGVLLWGGGEYQHPLGGRLWLRAGADLAQREYDGKAFDQTVATVYAGPRWLVGAETEMSLLGNATRRLAAGRTDTRGSGVRLESEHRFGKRLKGRARVSWQRREYPRRRGLDGPVSGISLGFVWRMTPTLRGTWGSDMTGNVPSRGSGATPGAGYALAFRPPCRGVLPWAETPSSAGRGTRAAGFRSRRTAPRGRTGSAP